MSVAVTETPNVVAQTARFRDASAWIRVVRHGDSGRALAKGSRPNDVLVRRFRPSEWRAALMTSRDLLTADGHLEAGTIIAGTLEAVEPSPSVVN